jgi:hypothetical protein
MQFVAKPVQARFGEITLAPMAAMPGRQALSYQVLRRFKDRFTGLKDFAGPNAYIDPTASP